MNSNLPTTLCCIAITGFTVYFATVSVPLAAITLAVMTILSLLAYIGGHIDGQEYKIESDKVEE